MNTLDPVATTEAHLSECQAFLTLSLTVMHSPSMICNLAAAFHPTTSAGRCRRRVSGAVPTRPGKLRMAVVESCY
jgi:hypothetical protein